MNKRYLTFGLGIGLCAATAFGTQSTLNGVLTIDGEVVSVAAESGLGENVSSVVLQNGGGVGFTATTDLTKAYTLNGTGVVSVADGMSVKAVDKNVLVMGTLGQTFVKRGAGTLTFVGGPGVVPADKRTRWIVEEGVLQQNGGDFFGNHSSTTTNLTIDVRKGATYRTDAAHCPMGPVELTGATLDLTGSSTTAQWGTTAFRGGVLVHDSDVESLISIGGHVHLNHVYTDVPFCVGTGAVLNVRGVLSDGWNLAANDHIHNCLVACGGGTIRLYGYNDFTGGIRIMDGTKVVLVNPQGLGSGGIEVDGEGTLEVVSGCTYVCPKITGSGTLTKTGLGGLVVEEQDDAVTLVRAEGEGTAADGLQNGVVQLNGGVVSIDVPAGETRTASSYAEAMSGALGRTDIVKTGDGTLVLESTAGVSSFRKLSVRGGDVRISEQNCLGSGPVTLTDGARLSFTAGLTLSRLVNVVGAGGFNVAEGAAVYTSSNYFHAANAVFTKTGAGELRFTGTGCFCAGDVGQKIHLIAHEGTLVLSQDPFGGHTTNPSQTLEVHAGAQIVSLTHTPSGRIIMRGGTYRHVQSSMLCDATYTGRVEDRIYRWKGLSFNGTIEVYPSSDGSNTTSVIRAARSYLGHDTNKTTFNVAEGAVLHLETRLENGLNKAGTASIDCGFAKEGAGELVLDGAVDCTGTVNVNAGTVTLGKGGSFSDRTRLSVMPGASVRLSDGTVLGASLDAPDTFLATADIWMDASRCRARNGDSISEVVNDGTAGGAFRKFTVDPIPTAPIFTTNAINGLSALYFDGGSALVLDSYTNRTSHMCVFMVADWTSWDYNGGSGGKGHWGGGLSMSWKTATGTDNSVSQSFHTETSTTINNTYVQASGLATDTLSNPNRGVGTPYLDMIVLTNRNMNVREYTGDNDTVPTMDRPIAQQTFNIDLVAIGGRLGANGTAQYNGSTTHGSNRMYFGYIGELVVFTRELSAEEIARVATYLQRKWFNSSATAPDAGEGTGALNQATIDVPAGTGGFAGRYAGSSAVADQPFLVKTGDGTLALRANLSGPGVLEVAEGTLDLPGRALASRADVWMDADDADTVTLSDGKVTTVRNKGRTGGTFAQCQGRNDSIVPYPVYQADAINGRAALKFDTNAALMLNTYTNRNDIRSLHVYAVMRRDSYDVLREGYGKWGGPFALIGTSATGDDQTIIGACHTEETYTNSVSHYCGNEALAVTLPDGGLSTNYLFVSHQEHYGFSFSYEWADTATNGVKVYVSHNGNKAIDVDRVLLGGRGTTGGVLQWSSNNAGGNRTWAGLMGEFIVFTSPLSESEETALLNYLRAKWLGASYAPPTPPAFLSGDAGEMSFDGVGLRLDAGTAVVSDGPTLALASLTAGDGVAWTRDAAADPDGFAFFDVTGALALGANQTLNLVTAPSASAKLIGGAWSGELAPWTVTGDKASTTKVAARADGIWVGRATGAVIYLR